MSRVPDDARRTGRHATYPRGHPVCNPTVKVDPDDHRPPCRTCLRDAAATDPGDGGLLARLFPEANPQARFPPLRPLVGAVLAHADTATSRHARLDRYADWVHTSVLSDPSVTRALCGTTLPPALPRGVRTPRPCARCAQSLQRLLNGHEHLPRALGNALDHPDRLALLETAVGHPPGTYPPDPVWRPLHLTRLIAHLAVRLGDHLIGTETERLAVTAALAHASG